MAHMDQHGCSRRGFLKTGAASAAGAAVLRSAWAHAAFAVETAPGPVLSQFNYSQIQLGEGPMLEQFRHNHQLFLHLDEDSMLKPFRQLSGLPAPGEDMGGWYSPSDRFNPPKDMTGYVPGHSFGQYLSGLSRAYAVTGDPATKAKVDRLVAGFAPTVSTKFYEGYCLPAYTFEKTMGGMNDAYFLAKNPQAQIVLARATDAVLPWLPPKALNRKEMAARPHPNIAYTWDESYTLPENFYIAFQHGGGDRYRKLAQRFLQDDTYFDALAANQNVLPGEHAYSHVNALSSAVQSYLTDGSTKHLAAAKNGFRFVLEQSYATGGWGPDETFQKPGSTGLLDSLTSTHNSFETPCGAYGHFKIARYLMRVTGESHYGDSMEAVLYNTILGARPIRPDGISYYYSDYNREARKVDYEQKWPCCSGTFPQLTADYGISSYLYSPEGIFVNLYVPSTVSWKQGSAQVRLTQTGAYPTTSEMKVSVETDRAERFTIALRIPAWAGGGTTIRVNGQKMPVAIVPGQWARVLRTWRKGDSIEIGFDAPLRLVPLDPQHENVVALVRGPVALFAIEPGSKVLTRASLLGAQRRGNSGDWTVSSPQGEIIFRPFPAISTENYQLYHSV